MLEYWKAIQGCWRGLCIKFKVKKDHHLHFNQRFCHSSILINLFRNGKMGWKGILNILNEKNGWDKSMQYVASTFPQSSGWVQSKPMIH